MSAHPHTIHIPPPERLGVGKLPLSAIFAVLDEDCKRICRFNFEARLGVYPVLPLSDVLKPEGLVQLSEYLETNQVGIEWLIDAPGPTVPGAGGPERVPS